VYQGDYGWPILCGVRNNPEKFPPAYNFLEVMMETEKKARRTCRQSLVDVLEQEGCPFNTVWPAEAPVSQALNKKL
jgi:hypothetical protein